MDNKQSSVEWLFEQYKLIGMLTTAQFEKAKEMHNDEITKSMNVAFIDALKIRDENYKSPYEDWEQYYNETFGGNQ